MSNQPPSPAGPDSTAGDIPAASSSDAIEAAAARRYLRTTLTIGLATGLSSMSFDFWYPFMPLYLLKLGATSEANALFWIAVAATIQGVCRFLAGPVWGYLSDRVGRKAMLLRALYSAVPTILVAAFITAPWQISIAWAIQGAFSGFVPAAIALTSVSVPESRVGRSLSLVTGCQYLGTTFGPAIGALLATLLGYRGAILIAAMLPAVAATLVLFFVPRDALGARPHTARTVAPLEPFKVSFQFLLVIFAYFIIVAMSQLVRLATPVAIRAIHEAHVNAITGAAFSLGGFASAVSVLIIAPRFFRPGRLRVALIGAFLVTGVLYLLLSNAHTVPTYIACFTVIAMLQAAMVPAANTLIAGLVPRSRRGTGFGIASSAQALAFIAGPVGAALFGAVSLDLGFVVIGGVLLVMAATLWLKLVEPAEQETIVPASGEVG